MDQRIQPPFRRNRILVGTLHAGRLNCQKLTKFNATISQNAVHANKFSSRRGPSIILKANRKKYDIIYTQWETNEADQILFFFFLLHPRLTPTHAAADKHHPHIQRNIYAHMYTDTHPGERKEEIFRSHIYLSYHRKTAAAYSHYLTVHPVV